jgi:hypothetical protein
MWPQHTRRRENVPENPFRVLSRGLHSIGGGGLVLKKEGQRDEIVDLNVRYTVDGCVVNQRLGVLCKWPQRARSLSNGGRFFDRWPLVLLFFLKETFEFLTVFYLEGIIFTWLISGRLYAYR